MGGHESADRGTMRAVQAVFLALCGALCIVPLVGMAWASTTETTENRELASVPQIMEDGVLNESYLSDWGAYFEDHFAYRNELVSLNAELRSRLFGVSPTDSVVVGTEGWLYYGGTLSDYCGWSALSGRAVDNIAFNLSLMQGYCEAQGASFSVAIAPNKNSLYPQNMPYYYLRSEARSNLEALEAALDERGVAHADLLAGFESQDEVLYYLRDSHWNTKGALLACGWIEESLGRSVEAFEAFDPAEVDGYQGDLNGMLYPSTAIPETDYSYEDQLEWSFAEGEDVEDAWVSTEGEGSGSLLMFRDSFANNMLAFFADAYEEAHFSKLVPYDLTRVGELGVDSVVVERAERHLSDLGTDPAIMPAPSVGLKGVTLADGASSEGVRIEEDGSFSVVAGDLPEEYRQEDVEIFIGIEQRGGEIRWYVPFRLSTEAGDYGYEAYLPQDILENARKVWVACSNDGTLACVQSMSVANDQEA